MKKIKITFSISQKLSGHIKNVCVIARSEDECWKRLYKALNIELDEYSSFSVKVLNVHNVDESMPSGIFQADSQNVISCKGVALVIPGAALSDNSNPHSTNQI